MIPIFSHQRVAGICLAVLMSVSGNAWADEAKLEIVPDQQLIKPWRGMAYSETDVSEVRRLALEEPSNARAVKEILGKAAEWLGRSDEEIISLVPKEGATFAYGFAGDPQSGKPWPRFANGRDICSLDRPGEVRSPDTGQVYGVQKPGEEYYDDGNGWTRPSDGRKFYFKGIWNSYVVDRLHEGIDNLALAYLLTGDERLAHKALLIFDRLATLRARSPDYKCVIDSVKMAEQKIAFFRYQGNIANQRALTSAVALDLIAGSPEAAKASSLDAGITIRDNIKDNYFSLYEHEYYLGQRGGLTNHGSILFGNAIAQGVLFGKPELLRTGIEALYAFMDSTINRDGDYMELAGGYGRLGRDYGSRLVALLQYYDPNKYENAGEMPKREDYPYNLRVANDPRWYQTVVKMLYRMTVAGRYPQYGDVTPDRMVEIGKNNEWLDAQRNQYLRMYREQTTREDWKKEISELYYADEPAEITAPLNTEDLLLYGKSMWKPLPRPETPAQVTEGRESEVMGGKAVAILRSGDKNNRRALFMRGGANGAHGHDDQMAIVPYGHGMVLAGVYGYASSETPDHLSWGSRAIAHLTATVNEDLPPSYLYKGFGNRMNSKNRITDVPAGSVVGFGKVAPAQFIEMRNPGLWKHIREGQEVSEYRRTVWMIDVDVDKYYFVDIFRLIGGRTHDYVWNAMWAGNSPENFRVEEVEPQAVPGVWTLAALSGKWRKEKWNQPGKSWGERLDGMAAGRILPLPGEKEGPGLSGQKNPPVAPGNGYGMIWNVKAQETAKDWKAIWKLQDKKNWMRAWMVNYDGMTAITGQSPTLLRNQHHNVALGRRQTKDLSSALQSRFVNVVEVGNPDDWLVKSVTPIAESEASKESLQVALKIGLAGGMTDYVLNQIEPQTSLRDGDLSFEGQTAFVRLDPDGNPRHLFMQRSTTLSYGGWKLECATPVFEAKVVSVNAGAEGEIVLDRALPAGPGLRGQALFFRGNPNATVPVNHDEYYEIEEAVADQEGRGVLRFRNQSLAVARAQIESVDSANGQLLTRWPCELAGLSNIALLNGRAISVNDAEPPVALVKTFSRKELVPTTLEGFQPGQQIKILAAQPGDIAMIPSTIALTKEEGGRYQLSSNTEVKVTLPAARGAVLKARTASGREKVFGPAETGSLQATLAAELFENGQLALEITPP